MEILSRFLTDTPFWVYLLFLYLILRGIKARKPGEVTLGKLAIIPLIFTIMGLAEMQRLYGFTLETVSHWLASLLAGTATGTRLISIKSTHRRPCSRSYPSPRRSDRTPGDAFGLRQQICIWRTAGN